MYGMVAKRDQSVILRLIRLIFFDVFVGAGFVVIASEYFGTCVARLLANSGIRLVSQSI